MSVHTIISYTELEQLLQDYSLGNVIGYQGIADGITNTIYSLTTTTGRYIVTLFETLAADELPFFIDFMTYLQAHQFPCPQVIPMNSGEKVGELFGKPLLLTAFLPGVTLHSISSGQAQAAGDLLGRLHQLSDQCDLQRDNPYDLAWHHSLAAQLLPHLTNEQQTLLQDELAWQQQQDYSALPMGVCHMDLFPDNVLFQEGTLTGVLDFYFACSNYYLLDLAVAMCAWSLTDEGLNKTLGEHLMVQYQMQRPLTKAELPHLKNMQRYAALHFWLTRLRDQCLVPAQPGVLVKDPKKFEDMLLSFN